jgi:hypothetical protein
VKAARPEEEELKSKSTQERKNCDFLTALGAGTPQRTRDIRRLIGTPLSTRHEVVSISYARS